MVAARVVPAATEVGIGVVPYFPLASGLLTGKYNVTMPDDSRLAQPEYEWLRRGAIGDPSARRMERVRRFTAVAKELGVAPAPLAIAWCLRNPHVSSVLLGATRVEQLMQNLDALALVDRFDEGTWARIGATTA